MSTGNLPQDEDDGDASPIDDNEPEFMYTQVASFTRPKRQAMAAISSEYQDNRVIKVRVVTRSRDTYRVIHEATNTEQHISKYKLRSNSNDFATSAHNAATSRAAPPILQLASVPHQEPQAPVEPAPAAHGYNLRPRSLADVVEEEIPAEDDEVYEYLSPDTLAHLEQAVGEEVEELDLTQPRWFDIPEGQMRYRQPAAPTNPSLTVPFDTYFNIMPRSESFPRLSPLRHERVGQPELYFHIFYPLSFMLQLHRLLNLILVPQITISTLYRFFGAYLLQCTFQAPNREEAFANPFGGVNLTDYISLADFSRIFVNLRIQDGTTLTHRDRENELDLLSSFYNHHMRLVFKPGNRIHADESMVGWFGRARTWRDGNSCTAPHVFLVKNKPTSRGFMYKNLACVKSKVIFAHELQHRAETMQQRKIEQHAAGLKSTTATLLRLIDNSNIGDSDTRPIIFGDSYYSSFQTAALVLTRQCDYTGHVRHQFSGFPHSDLMLRGGNYARLSCCTANGAVYASREDIAPNRRIFMISTIATIPDNRNRAEGLSYRENSHAVDNNNQVHSYLNTETTAVIKDYRIKLIMAQFGLCLTNAFQFYKHELSLEQPQRENTMVSHKFAMLVGKHLLQNNFGVAPVVVKST